MDSLDICGDWSNNAKSNTLPDIARELVAAVRANVKIDWTIRENVQEGAWPLRAGMRPPRRANYWRSQ